MTLAAGVSAKLDQAMRFHRDGALGEAIKAYTEVVRAAPRHAPALNLLGLAYGQKGELDRAVEFLKKALAEDPRLPQGHFNLARMLQGLQQYEDARLHYQQALAAQPGDAEIHNNLGAVLRALGRHQDAVSHYQRALELRPNVAALHLNLGNVLHLLGRDEEACLSYSQAASISPTLLEARLNWGLALSALDRNAEALRQFEAAFGIDPRNQEALLQKGNALHKLGRSAEATACFRELLAGHPGNVQARISLGAALSAIEQHGEAIAEYDRVLQADPRNVVALLNRGNALKVLDRIDEAVESFSQAARCEPENGEAHFSLGAALEALERNEEALQSYERAIVLMPGNPNPRWYKAHLNLSLGRLREGWQDFENRWAALALERRFSSISQWDGGRVAGTLLVWGEQGIGDQILYGSMFADLRDRADAICVEVDPRLVPLFARSFPDIDVVAAGTVQEQAVAKQVAMASSAPYLRSDWAAFPASRAGGYLKADSARAQALRQKLKGDGRRIIGLSWQSTNPIVGKAKTASLRDFAPMLKLKDCRFIDLQYGDTATERREVEQEFGVAVERIEEIDNHRDLDGFSALVTSCDAVLSVSNSTAHMAGALGTPAWVLLPAGNARFWYWFRDRADSPWYPSVKIRRRLPGQPWADLISGVANEVDSALKKESC